MKNILEINSSGRFDGSQTRQLSALIVDTLSQKYPQTDLVKRDLSQGLPFLNEDWITATFTAPEERTEEQHQVLSFSTELVSELQQADYIVIGTPIYNFSVPAALKAWIDLIARVKLTFEYSENGPVGLLKNKRVFVSISSGGVAIGSEMDFASKYLKVVLGFIGITDVTVVDASTINLIKEDQGPDPISQIEAIAY